MLLKKKKSWNLNFSTSFSPLLTSVVMLTAQVDWKEEQHYLVWHILILWRTLGLFWASELQAAGCNGEESSFLAHSHLFNRASIKRPQCTLALFLNRCVPLSTLHPHGCVMPRSTHCLRMVPGTWWILQFTPMTYTVSTVSSKQERFQVSGCSDGVVHFVLHSKTRAWKQGPMYCVNMKEFWLIFHRCFTCILDCALHCGSKNLHEARNMQWRAITHIGH